MINLSQVTLVAMAGVDIYATVRALIHSSKNIEFGRVLLISHKKPWYLPSKIDYEYTSKNKDMYEWCYKIVYDLHEYIDTEFIMLIHSDGFVVNADQWKDEFFEYDYIGSPWPIPDDEKSYKDANGVLSRVGNSVSLRSKKILELPTQLDIPWPKREEKGVWHEDGFLCCDQKIYLEEHGLKFAPLDVAKYFAHETMIPEIEGIKPFAFHRYAGTNSKYPKFRRPPLFFKD